jgi:hypothetical protein
MSGKELCAGTDLEETANVVSVAFSRAGSMLAGLEHQVTVLFFAASTGKLMKKCEMSRDMSLDLKYVVRVPDGYFVNGQVSVERMKIWVCPCRVCSFGTFL